MLRDWHMVLVVNQAERAIIADAADAAGLSLSSYLRTSALAAARVPIPWAPHDATPLEFTDAEREILEPLAAEAEVSFAELVRMLTINWARQILERAADMTEADRVIEASRAPA